MANLVLASKRELKSGEFWHVYRSEDNNKSEEFYFANPLKALRYAFILRKRHGAIIPKGIYNKLMADVNASKNESTAPVAPAGEPQSAPAELEISAKESAPVKKAPKRTRKASKKSENKQ